MICQILNYYLICFHGKNNGPIYNKGVNVGETIMCTDYTPKGPKQTFRYKGDGLIDWYPTPEVALSWDKNWPKAKTVNCRGFVYDTALQKNI